MVRTSKATLQELAELLMDWPLNVSAAVADPSKLNASPDSQWATEVTGPCKWAFDDLKKVIVTEELASALDVVVHWGMAGMLRSALVALDKGPDLASRFTDHLHEGGYIPFVTMATEDDSDTP